MPVKQHQRRNRKKKPFKPKTNEKRKKLQHPKMNVNDKHLRKKLFKQKRTREKYKNH